MTNSAAPKAFAGDLPKEVPPRLPQGLREGSAASAWAIQGVHEGSASGVPTIDCSIGLFHPIAFDLEDCSFLVLLSASPVMAGFSKQFIQNFLPSFSCSRLLLELSYFFAHCTKAFWYLHDELHGADPWIPIFLL